jgi:hypothetical protein
LVDDAQLNKECVLCRHCHQVGHVELKCFDLHPCVFCGKKNHVSERCWKRINIKRKHVNFEWLGTWHWSLEAKLLERSYQRVYTQVQPYLIGNISTVDGHECFLGLDDTGHDQGPLDVVF